MSIRPFEWHDLPILHRYRARGVFLDNVLALTRNPVLIPAGALLSWLSPATGFFTYLCEGDDCLPAPLVAQVMHTVNAPIARLSFLAPEGDLDALGLPALLDFAAREIGERGAFHILAEVDEHRDVFEALRKAGFAIYARQRVWQLKENPLGEDIQVAWRGCNNLDMGSVRSLYSNLVPGLVQQVEPLPPNHLRGLVCYQDGDLLAYLELRYGPAGIWVQPFVHPDAQGFAGWLKHLLSNLPNRRTRPIYLCVRSYQSWLEGAIEEMGAQPGPRQAVMVRHLALPQRVIQPATLPAMNGTRAGTTPVARILKMIKRL
jgi:hypothetical protein